MGGGVLPASASRFAATCPSYADTNPRSGAKRSEKRRACFALASARVDFFTRDLVGGDEISDLHFHLQEPTYPRASFNTFLTPVRAKRRFADGSR